MAGVSIKRGICCRKLPLDGIICGISPAIEVVKITLGESPGHVVAESKATGKEHKQRVMTGQKAGRVIKRKCERVPQRSKAPEG